MQEVMIMLEKDWMKKGRKERSAYLSRLNEDEKYEALNDIIDTCQHIVFFGGAGVSTESGIPDFRSKDGLYNQHDVEFDQYSPEYLLSHECLVYHPKVFFEFYRQKLDTRSIKPNRTHYKLALMEEKGKLDGVITQNIDGLHQKAGSKHVYEIHGTTYRNYCMKCKKIYPADYIFTCKQEVPYCPDCGGMIRPDVTMYGEGLPGDAWLHSRELINHADCLIIGGTSLNVYPAANLIDYFHGDYLILMNKGEVGRRTGADLVFNDNIGKVMDHIVVKS